MESNDEKESTEKVTFGKKLASAREELGLSQEEFSIRLGVALADIEDWENDVRLPSISDLKLLSKVLGVSIDYLLEDEEDEDEDDEDDEDEFSLKVSTKETIDLNSYEYKVSLGGRWLKKSAQKDRVVRTKFPDAKIYMLVTKKSTDRKEKIDVLRGKKKARPDVKIAKASYYLVKEEHQHTLVAVTDDYIECFPQVRKVTQMRFRIGNYEFTNVGLIDE